MLRGSRIVVETLMVEAACVTSGYLIVDMMNWPYWGLLTWAVLAVAPAPIYAGWRSPELSLGVGAVTGVAVCVGMITFLWTQAHQNPCPPLAIECFQFLGAYLGTFFALIVVLPAFMALTPITGLIFDRLNWGCD